MTVARRLGLEAERASVLPSSGREVLLLEPCRVVAKVSPSADARACDTELALAVHLHARDAPVVPPLLGIDPMLYTHADRVISFWKYCAPDGRSIGAEAVSAAYTRLSPHLQSFAGELPDFREPIRACQRIVADGQLTSLPREACTVLRDAFSRMDQLDVSAQEEQTLHGDPHAGNLLSCGGELLWLDFASACRGPLEWDLGSLLAPVEGARPELLRQLSLLRSACVVVWCALKQVPTPPETEAIEFHLARLAASSVNRAGES